MVPLRVIAICSNVLFIAFGAFAHIHPVLVLHIILLPVNIAPLRPGDRNGAHLLRPSLLQRTRQNGRARHRKPYSEGIVSRARAI
jgi:hypothetical protein